MVKTFNEFFKKSQPQTLDENYKPVVAPTAQQLGIKMKGGFAFHPSVIEEEEQEILPAIKLKKQRRDYE
jgi:hypothetical protein